MRYILYIDKIIKNIPTRIKNKSYSLKTCRSVSTKPFETCRYISTLFYLVITVVTETAKFYLSAHKAHSSTVGTGVRYIPRQYAINIT